MTTKIRAVIKATGTLFGVLIGIIIPVGYALDEYVEARNHVYLDSAVSAEKIAAYAYVIGALWHYTPLRLEALISDRFSEERTNSRQRVIGPDGQLVFEEVGTVAWPTLTRAAPIRVSGKTIGRVETVESLRPLVIAAIGVALISCFLGLGGFVLFREFPLRVLDRTLAHLGEREAELHKQYIINASALNNMSQGLCMFDAGRRLIICNRRFAALYDLPEELTRPGTPLSAILEHRVTSGNYSGDAESYIDNILLMVTQDQQQTQIVEQKDGRTIEIVYDPLQDGGWVATHEDVSSRRRAEARIAYLASHDSLTELPNRMLLRQHLEKALAGIGRRGSIAVHSLDLDCFKDVNDTLGHPIGDALLQEVAKRLQAQLREGDMVGRLGGDEFAIIQTKLERPEAASDLAERLIGIIGAPYLIQGHHVSVGASFGVTIAPADGVDGEQLMKNSDLALYGAKSNGRGTFRFFEREMDIRLQARRQLEQELRTALPNGEFEVFYQPLFNIAANRICGFEALLRWHHPERGIVSPDDFIPLAEETGLIVQIGEWVLHQACSEAMNWPADITVAVNLSPVQFKRGGLTESVVVALAASQLSPHRLELEITESVLLQQGELTLATMHKLRAVGVRIAMDDFGTGYSSLSYLRSFPFDKIKIDRSFVRHVATEPDASAIVRAVTRLAHDLGMSTTAEGVESYEALDILRKDGCTEIQGFLISAAAAAHAVPDLLVKFGGDRAKLGIQHAVGKVCPGTYPLETPLTAAVMTI